MKKSLKSVVFPFAFAFIKQQITETNGKNNVLEIMLEDANRLMKFYLTKEKSLIEGEFLSLCLKTAGFLRGKIFMVIDLVFVCLPLLGFLPNDSPELVSPVLGQVN